MRRARLSGKVPLAEAEPPAGLRRAQGAELALLHEAGEVGGGVAGPGSSLGQRQDTVLVRRPHARQVLEEGTAKRRRAHLGADLLVVGRPGFPLRDELGFGHGSSSSLPSAMSFSAVRTRKAIARCG